MGFEPRTSRSVVNCTTSKSQNLSRDSNRGPLEQQLGVGKQNVSDLATAIIFSPTNHFKIKMPSTASQQNNYDATI